MSHVDTSASMDQHFAMLTSRNFAMLMSRNFAMRTSRNFAMLTSRNFAMLMSRRKNLVEYFSSIHPSIHQSTNYFTIYLSNLYI